MLLNQRLYGVVKHPLVTVRYITELLLPRNVQNHVQLTNCIIDYYSTDNPLACMPHPEYRRRRVVCSDRNKPGSVCNFFCEYGYFFESEQKPLTCGDYDGDGEGEWDHDLQICQGMYHFYNITI